MMKSFRAPMWIAVKRMILAVGIVGALHAAAVTQAEASASCTAVNSGSFNLTTPASDPGNTSILSAWTVGDRITATFTDAIGFSHADGFFNGPTLGGIGALEQGTVSSGGNVQLMHTVVSGDLTNGILLDPENNDSVTATCITALILTSTPSSTLHVNQSYSQSNVASGGTASYTYSVSGGAVPAGTSLNTATGLVSGSPTTAGPFSYTITATDSSPAPALTASQTISDSIIPANSSSTSLTSSANPSILGASVTFTATVTGPGGTPTGSVTFYDGASPLGSNALVSGTATLPTSALTVGSHSISAVYSGDANYGTSASSTLSQAVGVQNAYVSGVGVDSGGCQRDAPCQTFTYALSVTAAGGEINCVDRGGFGTLTITKSISIKCDGYEGGVLASGTDGIVVNAASTDVVHLSGLDFEGLNTGLNGVLINSAANVHIVNCAIHGFNTAGINVANSTSGVRVDVVHTVVADNAGEGIISKPTGSVGNRIKIDRTRVSNNGGDGVMANGTVTTGSIKMSIRDSEAVHNAADGYVAFSAGAVAEIMIDFEHRLRQQSRDQLVGNWGNRSIHTV